MSFNNRNLDPKIWETPRHNHPQPFINNQPNFFGNNNLAQNFPRTNFHPQQNNQIRPLLGFPLPPLPPNEQHPNFRNFNNSPDFLRSNNNRGRPNFHNQKSWQGRGNDKDGRLSDSSSNDRNDRFNKEQADDNDDSRPKSLVEHLKSAMKKNPRSKSQENNTNESIDNCAKNASKKLLSQLKTMDKDNVKELINNPKQPHRKAVLNIQAREKLREGMRKQLNKLGAEDENEASFDAVESVNYENIPETLIAQIGRTVDIDLNVENMDLQQETDEEIIEDKDIEVVKKNLGNDFLYGSEMLLMNGFNLLGESENETDIKFNDDRFFPPPLPAEPIVPKPPEPIPVQAPVDVPTLTSANVPWQVLKPPLPQRVDNDWELNAARNPDPPNEQQNISNSASQDSTNEKFQVQPIQVIVSNPPQVQIVPPSSSSSNTSSSDNSSNIPIIKHENPLLIPLAGATTPKTSINDVKKIPVIEDSRPKSTLSQDSFKTPTIPEPLVSSTPLSEDFGKTPLIDEAGKTPFIGATDDSPKIGDANNKKQAEQQSEKKPDESAKPEARRANETYGEYRRRLAGHVDDDSNKPKDDFNRPNNNNNRPQPRKQVADWEGENPSPQSQHNDKSSWMSNNQRNNNNNNNSNNDKNNRKSRFEQNRSRDRQNNRQNNNFGSNNNNRRNSSRERNSREIWDTRDRDNAKNMNDAFNYRFDSLNSNSHDGNEMDRLNTLLNPKPVQFKGSFNKRSGYPSHNSRDFNRSRSRERTPAANSVEREFSEVSFSSSANDARPCYHTLKKIMELDGEISRVHEKIHGIDKVITNLQTERVGYQKTFTRLQHDRNVLFNNLMKRAMQNENSERTTSKERPVEKSSEPSPSIKKEKESSSSMGSSNKKSSESSSEQKKRRIEEPPIAQPALDDEAKKKKKYMIEEEPKSAVQKAKEREEEERRKRIEEIRRQKQLRREREEAERKRLEEEAKKESKETIPVINRDKMKDIKDVKDKERDREKRKDKDHKEYGLPSKIHKSSNSSKDNRTLINRVDVIDPGDVKMKSFSIKFHKISLAQDIFEQYMSARYPEIPIDQLPTSSTVAITKDKAEEKTNDERKEQPRLKSAPVEDPLAIPPVPPTKILEDDKEDPLTIDENQDISSPPTPGSNLKFTEVEDTTQASVANDDPQIDYSEWTGSFESHDQPIVHLQNIDGKQMVCAAEDGKLYKYDLVTGECKGVFSEHSEICNSFLYDNRDESIYTASTDGFVHKIKFKSFESIASKQLTEALQVIEQSKYALYVGAKSGNIYKLKMDFSDEDVEPLCCLNSLILCMRWTKEGSRHILLISSRNNAIQVRDANDGLLLRTLSNDLTGVSIYDMLLEGSTIYCGSNLHEIFVLDFTTGALIKKHRMSGAGAINVRIYKNNLIVACYDGNIYVFDLNADDGAVNLSGPSNMLLAMDLWNDKIIASTKDKTLKIMSIST